MQYSRSSTRHDNTPGAPTAPGLTDNKLSFTENNVAYSFNASQNTNEMAVIEATQDTSDNSTNAAIIPSQGFSFNSLWRGVLGMVTLIFIAFLFSANRKAVHLRAHPALATAVAAVAAVARWTAATT